MSVTVDDLLSSARAQIRRLDPRARRVLMELYDLLASR